MNIYRKEFDCHFHQPKILVKKNLKIWSSFKIGACHYLVSFSREYVCRCKIYVKLETSNVVKPFVCRDLPRDSDFPPRNCHIFSFLCQPFSVSQTDFFLYINQGNNTFVAEYDNPPQGWLAFFIQVSLPSTYSSQQTTHYCTISYQHLILDILFHWMQTMSIFISALDEAMYYRQVI